MFITIKGIYSTDPILIGALATPGLWVDFDSGALAGQAIFVSVNTNAKQLSGQSFHVETGYKTIKDYQVLSEANLTPVSIRPLPYPGDYDIVAEVKSVTPLHGETNEVVFDAGVDQIQFTLTSNEIEEAAPTIGDIIYFKLIELSLWDQNI